MSEPLSVREWVRGIQVELRKADLDPTRQRQMLIELTSLYGNCRDECRDADAEYALVLLEHLRSTDKASHAKIAAETTPAFARKRAAYDVLKLVEEMVRSLKLVLRSASTEYREMSGAR